MQTLFTLEELLKFENDHYSGGCFQVIVDFGNRKKMFSFIKGWLGLSPKKFNHPLYNVNHKQHGAYVIREINTGQLYFGSSEKVYHRIARHKSFVEKRIHSNSTFAEILKSSQMKDFELMVIFTDSRKEAFDIEQMLVDCFKDSGLLINIANDVRYAMLGHKQTDEHKSKIAISNTGRVKSEETRKKISLYHRTDKKAIEQFASVAVDNRRKISVDGVIYNSLKEAVAATSLSNSFLRRNAKIGTGRIQWMSESVIGSFGKKISDEHKNRLSEFRKTDEKAINQFALNRVDNRIPLILNGVEYPSILDAAKISGIGESTIRKKLVERDGKRSVPYVLNYLRQ